MFPFLSIGNIFSFSGGAGKKKNKGKRTKKRLQSNKKINKTSRKNLSRKKATRKKIISKRRPINKKKRIRTIKKVPRVYSKKKKQCNCDQLKKYTGNELSPEGLGFCSHCIPSNVTMKGLDGNLWENQEYSKGRRWVKIRIDMN